MRSTHRHLQFLGLIVLWLINPHSVNAQNKRTVHVQATSPGQLKLLRPEGTTNVTAAAASVDVKRGELLFERLNQQTVVIPNVDGFSRQELPYKFYGVSSDGRDLNLGVVVDIEGGGMRPSPNASTFVGRLRFGIFDKQNPNSRQILPTPVNFLVTANVDSILPDAGFSIDHTNLPFAALVLAAASPGDAVTVQIRPSFSATDPVRVDVEVIRPELRVHVSPTKIQGWGLEEADITVEAKGIEQPENARVTLDASKGGLDKTSLSLDKDGVGIARIRSIGIGSAKIGAESSRLKSAQAELRFTLPWAFALSSILGGIAGVLAKKLRGKSKNRKLKLLDFLAGMALGVLAAAAYAVGVNLAGYVPQAKVGEALTFVIAGIVAYAGDIPQKNVG